MGSVEVTSISLPRDIARFVQAWFPIYENDPHWVPPLLFDRKRFLDPSKNPYFKAAQVQCFIATLDGRDVGTIAAIVDTLYQEHDPGAGFFGFFEFIDDATVADALFSTARSARCRASSSLSCAGISLIRYWLRIQPLVPRAVVISAHSPSDEVLATVRRVPEGRYCLMR